MFFFAGLCTCLRSKYGEMVCGGLCSQSFVPFQKSYLLVGVLYFIIAVTAMNVFYIVIFRVVKKKTFSENKSQMNKVGKQDWTIRVLRRKYLCDFNATWHIWMVNTLNGIASGTPSLSSEVLSPY